MVMIWNYPPHPGYQSPAGLFHPYKPSCVTFCDCYWVGGAPTEVMIRFPLVSTRGFTASPMLYNQKSYTQKCSTWKYWKNIAWRRSSFSESTCFSKMFPVSSPNCFEMSNKVFISFVKSHLNQSSPGFQNCWKNPTQRPRPKTSSTSSTFNQPSIPLGTKIILNLQSIEVDRRFPTDFSRWWL